MSLSEKSETEKSGVEEEVSMFWGSEVGLSGAVVVVLDGGCREVWFFGFLFALT